MRRGFLAGRRRRSGAAARSGGAGLPAAEGLRQGPEGPRGLPAETLPPAQGPEPDPAPPLVRRADLHRLSEGANGLNLWGYITADPLGRVLAPGYFAPVASWLAPFDRILVTAGAASRRPGHATLVVAGQGAEGPLVRCLKA